MNFSGKMYSTFNKNGIPEDWARDMPTFWRILEKELTDLSIDEEYIYNLAYLLTHGNEASCLSTINDGRLIELPLDKISDPKALLNTRNNYTKTDISNVEAGKKPEKLFFIRRGNGNNLYVASRLTNSRFKQAYLPHSNLAMNHLEVKNVLPVNGHKAVEADTNIYKSVFMTSQEHTSTPMKKPIVGVSVTQAMENLCKTVHSPSLKGDKITKPSPYNSADCCQSHRTSVPTSDCSYLPIRQSNKQKPDSGGAIENSSKTQLSIDETHIPSVASRVKEFSSLANSDVSCSQASNYPSTLKASASFKSDSQNRWRNNLQRSATRIGDRTIAFNEGNHMDYCTVCHKRIYPMDRLSIEDRAYHKSCFRCIVCQRTLLPGTFASLDGSIMCKPHYTEQFRKRGCNKLRNTIDSNASTKSSLAQNHASQNIQHLPNKGPSNEPTKKAAPQKPKFTPSVYMDKPYTKNTLKTS